jgi:NADH:ubiquinone oxidoreductase subunit 4 (subunit M)
MKLKIFFVIALSFGFLIPNNFVIATNSTTEKLLDSINAQNQAFEKTSEVGAPTDIRIIVAKIIKIFLGFVGFLATAYLVYGGYMYMTSAGNETRASDASKIMLYSALGILIILASYSITNFVYNSFQKSLKQTETTTNSPSGGSGSQFSGSNFRP